MTLSAKPFPLAVCLFSALSSVTVHAQTAPFNLSSSTTSVTLYPGTSQTIQVQASGTSVSPIQVIVSGLPTGVTVSNPPLILAPGASGSITLTAALNADASSFPAQGPADANTHTTAITVSGVAGPYTATSTLNLTVSLSNASFAPAQNQLNIPILRINTNNVGITSTDVDTAATITITSADGSTTYLPGSSDTDNTATFHIHGNTTAQMPKKPYTMKLGTSVDLLGLLGVSCPYVTSSGKAICDKSKSYVLLANYDDKSLLRDWSASALANAIPLGNGYLNSAAGSPTPSGGTQLLPWAPHSIFVEVYVDGAYMGNYQLIESVKVDSHRVNITELSETDTTDDITGGYLMEIDQHQDEAFVFHTPHGLPIGLIDPDFTPDPEVSQQTSYISSYVDTAENALFGSNFTSTTLGWRAYFDEAAAVNYYIVNDVMGNVDGGDFYSSVYLYKAQDNPLLYMGPIWDFDISSGNVNYEAIVNPTVPWVQTQALWYKQWFTDPGFAADVTTQWNALKNNGVFTQWLSSIQQQGSALAQSGQNNFNRWPILGETVWPNKVALGSYAGEVAYLTNWLNTRIAYLDSQFNHKATSTAAIVSGPTTAHVGDTLTYSVQVTGTGGTPTGAVTLLLSNGVLGTAQLDGSGHATITGVATAPGSFSAVAVYNGDSSFGLSQSNAEALTATAALVATSTVLTAPATSYLQGSSFVLQAQVTNQAQAAVPSGTVTFSYGGSALGQATVTNGVATLPVTAALTGTLPVGSYPVVATYSGDSVHTGSAATTTFSITSSTGATAAPTFSLASGSYPAGQTVAIGDSQAGAVIHYTVDGTLPTVSSPVYNTPIAINSSVTVQALAVGQALAPSAVATASYQVLVASGTGNGFAGNTSMVLNGSAKINGNALQLTDGGTYEAASAWLGTPVNVQRFTNDFTFQLVNAQADGMTFTLQGVGTQALGSNGCGLGYGACVGQTGSIAKSVGFKFDLYDNSGEGNDSFGIYNNGSAPANIGSIDLTSTGLNLHSGDVFRMHMVYDGASLQLTLTDTVTGKSVSGTVSGSIPAIVGGNTAYAGFTAGTGGESVTANILTWTYTAN
ncbi:CotH kinase family protein [Acidipila sp. EB88]|uniref:CotH kinase family protein n=1 Tax=Acidipila sp. EB88 TaxID=2305226 RepID=UPI00131507DD|nr:CotH kinase family protein [Acidipila sp. EB88]